MGYTRKDLPEGGGDYFKGTSPEFEGKAKLRLTITEVEMVTFEARNKGEEDRDKLVLSFKETDKKLPVNFSNGEIMFNEIAEDTDEWVGHRIILFVGNTKMGPGVKVKVPEVDEAPAKSGKTKPKAPVEDDDADEDDFE